MKTKSKKSLVDMVCRQEGSIVMLIPQTAIGIDFLQNECDSEPWQWMGNSLCVDIRMATEIVQGMIDQGLNVEKS